MLDQMKKKAVDLSLRSATHVPGFEALHEQARSFSDPDEKRVWIQELLKGEVFPILDAANIDIVGLEHLPTDGATVLGSGHQHWLDPFVAAYVACQADPHTLFNIVAKDQLDNLWLPDFIGSSVNFVDRENKAGLPDNERIAVLNRGFEEQIEIVMRARQIGQKIMPMIFPESTRDKHGILPVAVGILVLMKTYSEVLYPDQDELAVPASIVGMAGITPFRLCKSAMFNDAGMDEQYMAATISEPVFISRETLNLLKNDKASGRLPQILEARDLIRQILLDTTNASHVRLGMRPVGYISSSRSRSRARRAGH